MIGLILIFFVMEASPFEHEYHFQASVASDLQKYFIFQDKWLGADCGTSIQLTSEKSIWIWGDTLMGVFDSVHNKVCSIFGASIKQYFIFLILTYCS